MTSRERMIRAIEFKKPDRMPICSGGFSVSLASALMRDGEELVNILEQFPDDSGYSHSIPKTVGKQERFHGKVVDPWGVVREENIEGSIMMVSSHPLQNWEDIDNYVFPKPPPIGGNVFEVEKKEIQQRKKGYYVLGYRVEDKGGIPRGFNLFRMLVCLRGMENLMIDLMEHPKRVRILADGILEYNLKAIKRALMQGVDGIHFGDDLGGQNSLLISPKLWRNFFKPYYRRMFDFVHHSGAHVSYRSDGCIIDIIPDLIEIGIDVLTPQLSTMDMQKLSQLVRGKVCLSTALDSQRILPFGSSEEVRRSIKKIIELFNTPKGGCIGLVEGSDNIPLDNLRSEYQAFLDYGKCRSK